MGMLLITFVTTDSHFQYGSIRTDFRVDFEHKMMN